VLNKADVDPEVGLGIILVTLKITFYVACYSSFGSTNVSSERNGLMTC